MADNFTPINTQEEFDNAIKSRLERERATISKQYEDYEQIKKERDDFSTQIEDFQKTAKENADKISGLESQLAEEKKKAAGFELDNLKTQIAIDKGLPMGLRGRLNGTTKEELEKDADILAEMFKKGNNKGIPGFEPEGDSKTKDKEARRKAALLKVAKGLKEGE